MSTPKAVVSRDRELTAKDAFDYLDLVKAQFKDRPEVYDQFLDIMKGFKARTYVKRSYALCGVTVLSSIILPDLTPPLLSIPSLPCLVAIPRSSVGLTRSSLQVIALC